MEKTRAGEPVRRVKPRGDARKQELADVAERMFLKHGFAETTMQMIAREARASKETLYRHFTSKEALFAEIMRGRSLRLFGPEGMLDPSRPIREVLHELGRALLEGLVRPDRLALYRVVIVEAPRAPELGKLFWTQGPAQTQERLTSYLAEATERGALTCADPALASRLFLGSVVTVHHTKAMISPLDDPLPDALVREHVAAAVDMFLARFAATPAPARG